MHKHSSIVIVFLIAFYLLLFSGCITFKDSEGNRIDLDTNGTTVTSPDGIKLYKSDKKNNREVFYDKDINRHIEINNSYKDK